MLDIAENKEYYYQVSQTLNLVKCIEKVQKCIFAQVFSPTFAPVDYFMEGVYSPQVGHYTRRT